MTPILLVGGRRLAAHPGMGVRDGQAVWQTVNTMFSGLLIIGRRAGTT